MTGEFTARERLQARRLLTVLIIVALFFIAEFSGAWVAASEVLRIDAIHLLTDVAALGVALIAMRIAVRRPTPRFTFGLRRAEPVAAIFNALLVLFFTGIVVVDGIADLRSNAIPRADIMLYVAIGALVINGVSAWLIHGAIDVAHAVEEGRATIATPFDGPGHHHGPQRHHHHGSDHLHGHGHTHPVPSPDSLADPARLAQVPHTAHHHGHALNLRGALLHLLGDALGSLAALVAAVLIKLGFSPKVDSIASFFVAAILVAGAIKLLKDAVWILLEAAPVYASVAEVSKAIRSIPGVRDIHELHVWSLGAGHDAITAHVVPIDAPWGALAPVSPLATSVNSGHTAAPTSALSKVIEQALRRQFHAEYVTVQLETVDTPCEQALHAHPPESATSESPTLESPPGRART